MPDKVIPDDLKDIYKNGSHDPVEMAALVHELIERVASLEAEKQAAHTEGWNAGSEPPPITDTSHWLIHTSDEVLGFGKGGWVIARWNIWTDGKYGPCWMDKNGVVDVVTWEYLPKPTAAKEEDDTPLAQ